MGGGVYAVVDASSDYSRMIMHTKGLPPNSRGNAGLIYKPYHLCGVETAISLLSAVLLNQPTSGQRLHPHYDVVAQARVPLDTGSEVGSDKSPELKALMVPASPGAGSNPIPLHLARGNPLNQAISAGSLLHYDAIVPPEESILWELRKQQDALFLDGQSQVNP